MLSAIIINIHTCNVSTREILMTKNIYIIASKENKAKIFCYINRSDGQVVYRESNRILHIFNLINLNMKVNK